MEKLRISIKQFGRVAVALSGGADSAMIAREAAGAIGTQRVLAITAQTGCLPARKLFLARRIAQLSGIEHKVLAVESLTNEELQQNGPARCAQCRRRALQAILDEAWLYGCDAVLDGRHLGDIDRPAYRIAEELTFFSPYCDCEMGEAQLTMLRGDVAEELPEDSCLYSRFPAGMPIRVDLVHSIDLAEAALRAAGYAAVQLHVAAQDPLRQGVTIRVVAPRGSMEKLLQNWEAANEMIETHTGTLLDISPVMAEEFFSYKP